MKIVDATKVTSSENVPKDAVLVTNFRATRKFIAELDRRYPLIRTDRVSGAEIDTLLDAVRKTLDRL